jgi:hypothetical protein
VDWIMKDESSGMFEKDIVTQLNALYQYSLDELRKVTKNLSEGTVCPRPRFESATPDSEPRVTSRMM